MEERLGETLGIRRILAALLAVFGGISLLLAAIGLYGVIAQVVGERTQEIGIRMALGARPGQIRRQFVRQGLRSGIAGLAIGLATAAFTQPSKSRKRGSARRLSNNGSTLRNGIQKERSAKALSRY
jgi:cell division protein FtsX